STGELLVIPDLGASDGEPRARAAREAGIRTGVCLPLTMRGEVTHVLDLWSTRLVRLSEEQEGALSRLSRALSTTLERLDERDGFAWALRDFASELTDVSSALRATTAEQSASAQELASSIAQVRATLSQLRETSAEARR